MARKRFEGLTAAQERVFGLIAMNQDHWHPKRTLDVLERRGLIESGTEPMPGWPGATVKRYAVPIGVHIRWCEWCAEHAPTEEQAP
jgi:hypothetical protein